MDLTAKHLLSLFFKLKVMADSGSEKICLQLSFKHQGLQNYRIISLKSLPKGVDEAGFFEGVLWIGTNFPAAFLVRSQVALEVTLPALGT